MLALALAVALVPGAAPARASDAAASRICSDGSGTARRLELTVQGERTFGYFALPSEKPKGLVVFAHGHTYSAISWRPILELVAKRDQVAAVAMNYRNQPTDLDPTSPEYGRSTGWRVIEGGRDAIAAARYMMRGCERLKKQPAVAYGVSMGGAASGLAVSAHATRPDGKRPLFDYWFEAEGVANVAQEYMLTRLVGDPSAGEIEQDFGGTYEARTAFYGSHSIVNRARDIEASGIKGAVIVHATDDPKVPYDQSREMFGRLGEAGVPAQLFTINPADSPVGHGEEIDLTHPVIRSTLDRLAALFSHTLGARPRCSQEFEIDGGSAAITPDPATTPC